MFEEGESVTVNPQQGPIGEEFHFSAEGFTPYTPLKASIIGPLEQTIIDKDCMTDEQGRINFYESTDAWNRGTYKFKVIGKSSNTEKTVEGEFNLY